MVRQVKSVNDATAQLFLAKGIDLSYGSSSGMAVRHDNRQYLLTVAHMLPNAQLERSGVVPVAVADVHNGEIGVISLGPCPVYCNLSAFRNVETLALMEENDPGLDFTFFEIPEKYRIAKFNGSEGRSVRCYNPPFEQPHKGEERYSFSAAIHVTCLSPTAGKVEPLTYDHKEIIGLRVTDLQNTYVRFDLDDKSQFAGVAMKSSSGAPILDQRERPVALVVDGSEEDGYVVGVRLDRAWGVLTRTINGDLRPQDLSEEQYEKLIDSSIWDNIGNFSKTKG